MTSPRLGSAVLTLLACVCLPLQATSVVADFNDCKTGSLQSAAGQNANTGTGFSDAYWLANTSSVRIVAGDLTAPTSTAYAAAQTGTAQSAQVTSVSSTTRRQQYRTIATPLTGTVWGSLLLKVNDATTSLAGLTFNVANIDPANTTTAGKGRLYAAGSALLIQGWSGSAVTVTNQFTANTTALVLFRYVTSTQHLDVWINPVLPAMPSQLTSSTAAYSGTLDLLGTTTLTTIGLGGYLTTTTTGTAGSMDALRLSDGTDAYYDVTGFTPVVAPTITTQPADTVVAPGAPVALTVAANGSAPLAYQWSKDGTALAGATGSSYALTAAQLSDAGTYRCGVSNLAGSVTSNPAILTVATTVVAPTITDQTGDLAVPQGAAANFSVTISGTPPLFYQWQKDGIALAGATTNAYAIAAVQSSDAGAYRVEVHNVGGSVTSTAATLTVHIPPAIVVSPQDTVGVIGHSVSFAMMTTGAPLSYQWHHNGADIAAATSASLTLGNLQTSDAGSYSVTVSNLAGTATSSTAQLSLEATAPAPSGSAGPAVDAYVQNGTVAGSNFNAGGLMVAARSTSGEARKTYLGFDVPMAVKVATARNASVTLTLDPTTPYVGSAVSSDGSTLAASADVRIRSTSTGNQGAANDLAVGPLGSGDLFRSLISFDLSTVNVAAPASLSLRLTVSTKDATSVAGNQTLRLYRITGDWSEAQASWTKATSIRNWTTAGGDFEATPLSEVTLDPTTVVVGANVVFPSTDALRDALSETIATDGVLSLVVVSTSETAGQRGLFWFCSREDLGSEPTLVMPAGSVGAGGTNIAGNPMRLQLHAVVDNTDTWTETGVTWNTAPKNARNSATGIAPGAALLAETIVNTGGTSGGTPITFSDARIAQFLNWAVGRRGDLYGTGAASDADRRVTFVVTAMDAGTTYPALKFVDHETAPTQAPTLAYSTDDSTDAAATVLENDRYRVTLRTDRKVDVTEKASGVTVVFGATFDVLFQTADPSLALSSNIQSTVAFSVSAWGGNPDFAVAPGTHQSFAPTGVVAKDGMFTWSYAATSALGLRATLELPTGTAAPRLRWSLAPTAKYYVTVAYTGAPVAAPADVTRFYAPGIWSEQRFMPQQYVIDELRATTPAALLQQGTTVAGVVVDPFEIPNRISTATNSLFGLTARTTDGQVRPMVLAPLYGTATSQTDAVATFAVRLVVATGSIDTAVRDVAQSIYGFRDYRQNLAGGSLNQTLDNLTDFILNTSGQNYSYWMENEKANDYVNDKPGYARFQSAPLALGLAMVRDDAVLYEQRARPAIEFFVSRYRAMLKIDGFDADYPLGGPVTGYRATDWLALAGLTGRRTYAYEPLANDALYSTKTLLQQVDASASETKQQAFDNSFNYLRSLIQGYRVFGDAEYLADAKAIADAYIGYRINTPATDFTDVRSSFWNYLSPIWETLLELQDVTGDARYANAAVKAMDQFVGHINFAPAINDFTVDASGTVLPTKLVSEVGLVSEAGATSGSHRGIFVPYAAAPLLRVARLANDPFYASLGKANLIGRWLNYPGYTLRNAYNAAFLQANYPLRWYSSYLNSGHMNHPLPMAAMVADYLFADTEYRSQAAIVFPHQFSDSAGYFRARVFGHAPGVFYGDTGVWPWLPRAFATLSGTGAEQLNYVAGHGNGCVYLAFANQSATAVDAVLTLDVAKVTLTSGSRMRIWRENVAQADGSFVNGATTIHVAANGFTAIAIDGATPQLGLQNDYQDGFGTALPTSSYDRRDVTGLGRVVGAILSVSPSRQNAYVYTSADPTMITTARLRYQIDSGTETVVTKASYPFEFSITLPATAQTFTYVVEGDPVAGGTAMATPEIQLALTDGPIFTSQATSQTTTAGTPVTLAVAVDTPAGVSYQWRKEGTAIGGATDPALLLPGRVADSGTYDVVATNVRASSLSQSATVIVVKAATRVTLGGLQQVYTGSACPITVTTTPANLAVTVTYAGSTTPPTLPGTYAVVATINDPDYSGQATGTLVVDVTALVNHGPTLNAGIDGSLQVRQPDAITLNGSAYLSGDLLVRGTPIVRLNGSPTYAGTRDAAGVAAPSTATITLNGGAVLRHVVRRVDALTMPAVAATATPTGTRDVTVNQASQVPTNFADVRGLTLNSNIGTVALPAGAYGTVTVNAGNVLVLGIAGATTAARYDLQNLVLNGCATIEVAGPIVLTVGSSVAVNGRIGTMEHPEWLALHLPTASLTLNSGSTVSGFVVAPSGTVTINGGAELKGAVASDRLVLNGTGLLSDPGVRTLTIVAP